MWLSAGGWWLVRMTRPIFPVPVMAHGRYPGQTVTLPSVEALPVLRASRLTPHVSPVDKHIAAACFMLRLCRCMIASDTANSYEPSSHLPLAWALDIIDIAPR